MCFQWKCSDCFLWRRIWHICQMVWRSACITHILQSRRALVFMFGIEYRLFHFVIKGWLILRNIEYVAITLEDVAGIHKILFIEFINRTKRYDSFSFSFVFINHNLKIILSKWIIFDGFLLFNFQQLVAHQRDQSNDGWHQPF